MPPASVVAEPPPEIETVAPEIAAPPAEFVTLPDSVPVVGAVAVSEKFWVVVLPAVTLTLLTVEDVKPDFDAVTLRLEGHPDKLDDFEELLTGYGIVELQRSGRVALPTLERLRAVPSSNTKGRVG